MQNKILPIGILLLITCSSFAVSTYAQMSREFFASERLVIPAVRQIHRAEERYRMQQNGPWNYATLEQLATLGLIDQALGSGSKYGYLFAITVIPRKQTEGSRFRVTATPSHYAKTGRRSFYIDEMGFLLGGDKNGAPANENDPDVEDCALYGLADNERCSLNDMRTIHGAEATYQATFGNGNFGTLTQLGNARFIRRALASGTTRGYRFTVVIENYIPGQRPASMRVYAVPLIYGVTGIRSFFVATDGVIRGADRQGKPADENDPEIEFCAGSTSNEPCAISDMRSLHGAEATYQATTGNGNFGSLAQLAAANLIRPSLADGIADGYSFTVTTAPQVPGQNPASFRVSAVPLKYGVTGFRSFFIATDGVLRGADRQGQPANENDPPVEEW